ncbi:MULTISPECIES: TetR/AcrR family transcriptional regulator [Amycolatopsis]|uniref:TetR/AcrR family transcriptional regulator n=1 Tax=Amycolatopsis thermalba TaxID=944492 RepID=A0ABY4P4X6_9PSEU|nr:MULTISPECIES: TetR/AcrR family transcriptional regulator [Amycolatopsis]UQS27344.1 TetR/AcrR family transcriptional regulator [Amycolatopsis thermalba]
MERGLRKQRTRQAISDVATRLFISRGFEEVTIAQVAEAAQVAKMTVTNHFPRKEDLVFDVHESFVASLAEVRGRPLVAAFRRAWRAGLERRDALLGFSGPEFARMIVESPTLLARLRELHEEREKALAASLLDELDSDTARAVAAQIGSVARLLFDEVLRRIADGEPEAEVAAAVGRAGERMFDLLESGLGSI